MLRAAVLAVLVIGGAVAVHSSTRAASDVPRLSPTHVIPVGAKPLWVAVHPGMDRAYVTNSGDGTVSVIDLSQASVVSDIPVGPSPAIVAVDPLLDRAFVSDFEERTVTVIDLRTDSVIATLAVGGLGLAVDPDTHRVYAAGGDHIGVIDGSTAEVVAVFAAPAGANLWGLAVDGRAGRLFATDLASPRLLVFDVASGLVGAELALPAPARFAIGLDVAARRLHVATDVREVARLVTVDLDRLVTLRLAAAPSLPFGLAAGPGRVYVGAPEASEVAEFGDTTGERSAALETGRSALGVAVDGARVLALDHHDEILGLRGRLLIFEPPNGEGRP